MFVSSGCLVAGVYSVVSVSPSLVSSFKVIGGGTKNLKESICCWLSILFRHSGNSGSSSKLYFPAGWRTVGRTALLHSHKMVGLE